MRNKNSQSKILRIISRFFTLSFLGEIDGLLNQRLIQRLAEGANFEQFKRRGFYLL